MPPSLSAMTTFLQTGGPALWAIAALSVLLLALVLWKLWRFSEAGAWRRGKAERAVEALCAGQAADLGGGGLRMRFVRDCREVLDRPNLTESQQREEITRRAMGYLAGLREGLRPLDLIATIAPLVGLLGTVLGMIEAFQALQQSGAQADAAALAGGIWEALLTTAAGMTVAIPATMAQTWFASIAETVGRDFEDLATRLLLANPTPPETGAAR